MVDYSNGGAKNDIDYKILEGLQEDAKMRAQRKELKARQVAAAAAAAAAAERKAKTPAASSTALGGGAGGIGHGGDPYTNNTAALQWVQVRTCTADRTGRWQ